MLLPLATAFLSGLVLGAYLPYAPLTTFLLLLAAALASTVLEHRRRLSPRVGLSVYGCLLAGVLWWVHAASEPVAGLVRPGTSPEQRRLAGTIVEPVRHGPTRSVMTVAVDTMAGEEGPRAASGRLRLTWRHPDRVFAQGDRIAFTARIRPAVGTRNPGGFDYGAYLARRDIRAVASVTGAGRIALLEPGRHRLRWAAWHVIDGWRERIREAALHTLPASASGVYLSLVVGEQGYLAADLRDAFMASGTAHLLAISGTHLGLIAFLSFFVIRTTCRRLPAPWLLRLSRRINATRLSALLTIPPVTFYALLTGAELATVRALLMILVFLLAVWRGYRKHLLHALAVAALVILLPEPRALFDISFQLSFTAVLAIALILRWRGTLDAGEAPDEERARDRARDRIRRWIIDYAWITGGVTLATLPLVAYHFNQIAWLGLAANAVLVPLAGFVVLPLGLLSACLLLITGGQTLPLGFVNELALGGMTGLARLLAGLPASEWRVASPAVPAIALFYVVLLAMGRFRQAPSPWPRRAAAAGAACLIVWWAWSPRDLPGDGVLRVTFLDVGQGDAAVVELPEGGTILIDAGAAYERFDMGRAVVAPYLWDRGIRRLDLVVGTHPQLDHIGGLPWLLRRFDVGQYVGNGIARPQAFYARLREALGARHLVERRARAGEILLESRSCRFLVLHPGAEAGDSEGRDDDPSGGALNNQSVVTRLDCGPHAVVFAADVETPAQAVLSRAGVPLRAAVLKVPHHGARSSLHQGWIERVGARYGITSAGAYNAYRHPAPAVLRAYARAGTSLRRTDRDGAVIVTAGPAASDLRIRTARDLRPQPVRLHDAPLATEARNLGLLWRQWTGTD